MARGGLVFMSFVAAFVACSTYGEDTPPVERDDAGAVDASFDVLTPKEDAWLPVDAGSPDADAATPRSCEGHVLCDTFEREFAHGGIFSWEVIGYAPSIVVGPALSPTRFLQVTPTATGPQAGLTGRVEQEDILNVGFGLRLPTTPRAFAFASIDLASNVTVTLRLTASGELQIEALHTGGAAATMCGSALAGDRFVQYRLEVKEPTIILSRADDSCSLTVGASVKLDRITAIRIGLLTEVQEVTVMFDDVWVSP